MNPPPTSDDDLRRTAYHEAGHAVVAWHLGLEIRKVTIIPREGFLGRCDHTPFAEAGGADCYGCPIVVAFEAFGNVLGYMAGDEAELLVFGNSTQRDSDGFPSDHYAQASSLANGLAPDTQQAVWEACSLFCRDILTLRRRYLDALAEALLDRKTLTGDDVREVIAEKATEALQEDTQQ